MKNLIIIGSGFFAIILTSLCVSGLCYLFGLRITKQDSHGNKIKSSYKVYYEYNVIKQDTIPCDTIYVKIK
jgi:hypothetical protein